MSSAVDEIGSALGKFFGIAYQFTVTLSKLSGGGSLLTQVISAVIVAYILYRILKQIWGLLVFLLKLATVVVVAFAAIRAYQLGPDESIKVAKVYGVELYHAACKLARIIEIHLDVLDKYANAQGRKLIKAALAYFDGLEGYAKEAVNDFRLRNEV